MILDPARCKHYVEAFNRRDDQTIINHVPNAEAGAWLAENVPRFECPDKDIEEIYHFRWWVYRKHIKRTPDGFIVTEFLPPVSWAGRHNAIPMFAAMHLLEGRWLRDRRFLDDYTRFWYTVGDPIQYPNALPDAIVRRAETTGDWSLAMSLLPELVKYHHERERRNLHPCGLFWSPDAGEGEISISGPGFRPTLNCYAAADARAIARLARRAGDEALAASFDAKAEALRKLIHERLWDPHGEFFKVFPFVPVHEWYSGPIPGDLRLQSPPSWNFADLDPLHNVRELYGYLPWLFDLALPEHDAAWKQLIDPQGFYGAFGPTSAERRHPRYMFPHPHECLWNGPSWPANTCMMLVGLANLLHRRGGDVPGIIGRQDYLEQIRIFARSQHRTLDDGATVPWIDEDLHPDTGAWLSRERLHQQPRPDRDRGKDYNHSTFCDLVITGLCGLVPREDDVLEINPLLPDGAWDYFCLDGLPYHGRTLSILYDRTGARYGKGTGLRLLVDDREIAHAPHLERLTSRLPA